MVMQNYKKAANSMGSFKLRFSACLTITLIMEDNNKFSR